VVVVVVGNKTMNRIYKVAEKHCIHGLAFSSLAALAPRMLVLRISRRSLRSLLEMRIFFVKIRE